MAIEIFLRSVVLNSKRQGAAVVCTYAFVQAGNWNNPAIRLIATSRSARVLQVKTVSACTSVGNKSFERFERKLRFLVSRARCLVPYSSELSYVRLTFLVFGTFRIITTFPSKRRHSVRDVYYFLFWREICFTREERSGLFPGSCRARLTKRFDANNAD